MPAKKKHLDSGALIADKILRVNNKSKKRKEIRDG